MAPEEFLRPAHAPTGRAGAFPAWGGVEFGVGVGAEGLPGFYSF